MAQKLQIGSVVIDARDVRKSANFWRRALGYKVTYRGPEFVMLRHPTRRNAAGFGIQPTRSRKRGVNPLHFDLYTDDMEREASRLVDLGATRVRRWRYGTDEANWIVMRDPDGHEFCVVQK
ncbi:MAG: VOC family protein [Thermoplasmatota archaeon]